MQAAKVEKLKDFHILSTGLLNVDKMFSVSSPPSGHLLDFGAFNHIALLTH